MNWEMLRLIRFRTRVDRTTDAVHTDGRNGSTSWGRHGKGEQAEEDGRRNTKPKIRGGGGKNLRHQYEEGTLNE